MVNQRLIENAVNLVCEYYASEGISEPTKAITDRALRWYSNTEITDTQTLAAMVMYGEFEPSITYDKINMIRDAMFPIDSNESVDIKNIIKNY
jgi:hypothetical protein